MCAVARARASGRLRLPAPSWRPRSIFTGSSASAASVRPAPGPQRRKRKARPRGGRRSQRGCRRDPAPGPPLAAPFPEPGPPRSRRVARPRLSESGTRGWVQPAEGAEGIGESPSHWILPQSALGSLLKEQRPAIRVPGRSLTSSSPRWSVDSGGECGERG